MGTENSKQVQLDEHTLRVHSTNQSGKQEYLVTQKNSAFATFCRIADQSEDLNHKIISRYFSRAVDIESSSDDDDSDSSSDEFGLNSSSSSSSSSEEEGGDGDEAQDSETAQLLARHDRIQLQDLEAGIAVQVQSNGPASAEGPVRRRHGQSDDSTSSSPTWAIAVDDADDGSGVAASKPQRARSPPRLRAVEWVRIDNVNMWDAYVAYRNMMGAQASFMRALRENPSVFGDMDTRMVLKHISEWNAEYFESRMQYSELVRTLIDQMEPVLDRIPAGVEGVEGLRRTRGKVLQAERHWLGAGGDDSKRADA